MNKIYNMKIYATFQTLLFISIIIQKSCQEQCTSNKIKTVFSKFWNRITYNNHVYWQLLLIMINSVELLVEYYNWATSTFILRIIILYLTHSNVLLIEMHPIHFMLRNMPKQTLQ